MVFPTKKIAAVCPETRTNYQRRCLRTKEWVAQEKHTGPEAPDEAEALVAGAGGHQRAAQKASGHPLGLPDPLGASSCQYISEPLKQT
jgi:hypothetical protein